MEDLKNKLIMAEKLRKEECNDMEVEKNVAVENLRK
jgi:hypothetical protein